MKKRNRFLSPQKTKALHDSHEAWWYGQQNSILVVCEKIVGATVVTTQCKISRAHIERWLKEVKPKRKP